MTGWPDGISDGLSLPCSRCGQRQWIDYHVTDELWLTVVPPEWRLNVICLACLDILATEQGCDVTVAIVELQFTGIGKTAVFGKPERVHRYSDNDRKYPCRRCGKLRSKAEGGTTFTVCDECWARAS